jgi:mycothiol S-conjugate amidase
MNIETQRLVKSALVQYGIDSHWLEDKPARRTLLVMFGHPDDESFGPGGTLARYAATGVAVHYVCATRGECGTVAPAFLEGYKDIAELRTAEQDCAAKALGLRAVHYLGYRDSGMPGTPDNQHPNAFAAAPLEKVTGQMVALVRALRPQVLLTFGPYGGYGHPDHIRSHDITLAAFKAASDPTFYPEQLTAGLAPWSPSKLYYTTFNTAMLKIAIPALRLLRKDPAHFGENGDVDLVEAAAQVTPITTSLDCGEYLPHKLQAGLCHRSQAGQLAAYQKMPAFLMRQVLGTETFTRAIPSWDGKSSKEHELFAGIGF